MFELQETSLPDCYLIRPRLFKDARGQFVKTFHAGWYEENGLESCFREEFYSRSVKGVIRGLHFQVPPADHAKLVYCLAGEVFDAVVDLRVGSPTYGQTHTFELSADRPEIIYIPSGFAHGFQALSDDALMVYQVSTVHSPENDSGIHWDSVGIDWPLPPRSVSERDQSFLPAAQFSSPFRFRVNAQ